jgi:hypothetical protein
MVYDAGQQRAMINGTTAVGGDVFRWSLYVDCRHVEATAVMASEYGVVCYDMTNDVTNAVCPLSSNPFLPIMSIIFRKQFTSIIYLGIRPFRIRADRGVFWSEVEAYGLSTADENCGDIDGWKCPVYYQSNDGIPTAVGELNRPMRYFASLDAAYPIHPPAQPVCYPAYVEGADHAGGSVEWLERLLRM